MKIEINSSIQFLPCMAYIKNSSLEFIAASNELARHAGLQDNSAMLGMTDYDVPWPQHADLYRADDTRVLQGTVIEKFEPFTSMGNQVYILVRKNPVIQDNQIVGVAGINRILVNDIQKELSFLRSNDIKISSSSTKNYTYQKSFGNLTERESQILFYFLRGKTSKSIANILTISSRTVETHLINIKNKLNVHTKSQLFDFALNEGLLNVIPWHTKILID